jgi:adenosylhomocysteine nucleosidase
MKNKFSLHNFSIDEVLFVFALESEAAEEFSGYHTLITGIGKVSATYALTKCLLQTKPSLIINLGSAGSSQFKRGEVICCSRFIQRDMDVRGLGFQQYETPFSSLPVLLEYGIILPGLQQGICGSGDTFEMKHFCDDYNVIDMEAYALALTAMRENVPFLCLKYISDGADGLAADDWSVNVHKAAKTFKEVLF